MVIEEIIISTASPNKINIEIPGYQLTRPLGKGGMATVYLAIQQSFDREVALKIMAASLSEDASFTERFLQEAKVVSRLVHPHIVTVYDVGVHNGYHYLSMEYIPGKELKSCIAELSGEEILRVMREIASALDYAGQKGYVHRDVKPENIMLHAESGRAVLMDFGIAKSDEVGGGLTQTGMALGTPYYMSPEQARGKRVDGRADLYSLGIVFYKLLFGTVPYDGDSAVAIGIKHISEPIPELPVRLAVFQPILDKLLAKDPEQRYQRGADLVADLDKMSGEVIDKSRKQYFKKNLKSKNTTQGLSGSRSQATLAGRTANTQVLEAEQSRSKLWLLPLLLCAGLAVAYYHFFGLVFPPSQQAQQAALEELGLVEKPKLTLEQLLKIEPPMAESSAADPVSSGQADVEPLGSELSKSVSANLENTLETGADSNSDNSASDRMALVDEAPLINGEKSQALSSNTVEQLKQQAAELELAYSKDSSQLTSLLEAYQNILLEEPNYGPASQRLATLENELLEEIAVALDADIYEAAELQRIEALLSHSLDFFPALEANKRFQRLRNKLATQQNISQQLSTADDFFSQGQLLAPKDENAKAYYQAVLNEDPTNAKAKMGLANIAEAYYQKAVLANKQKAFPAALTHINHGLSVNEGHAPLKQLKTKVELALANEKAIASLLREAKQLQEQGDVFSGQPNAVLRLQSVLVIDASHGQAKAEIKQLVNQLNQQLNEQIDRRDLDLAVQALSPALVLLPDNEVLLSAQAKLNALQPVIEVLRLSGQPINDLSLALPNQFQAGRVLYIGFSYKNFSEETTVLQATLYDGEQTVQIAAVPVIVSGHAGNNFFEIKRPVEGFKEGGYRLEILLANKKIINQSFVIKP